MSDPNNIRLKERSSSDRPDGHSENGHEQNIRALLGLIALLALGINSLYFLAFRDRYVPDSPTYITPAANLIHGLGFTSFDSHPETMRTPGYPLLIAFFLKAGLDLRYLVILQHLMVVWLAVATAAAAFKLSRSRRLAAIAGILVSIDLPTLEASNLVLSDVFFSVTFAISLWLLWSASTEPAQRWSSRIFCSGLMAGAASLIRPVAQFFFLPVIIYLLLTMKRFRAWAVLGFVIPFLAFPVTWALRNYHEDDYLGVSSLTGHQLLFYRAAGILALDDPGNFKSNMVERRAQLESTACNDLRALYGKDCSELSFARRSEYFAKVGRKIIRQHPFGYVRLAVRGAAVLLLDGGPASLEGMTGINQRIGIRLLLIYTIPSLCFAATGLRKLWEQNKRLCLFFFLTIAYVVILSSGGESNSRYRVPIVPLYAILIACGIDQTFFHKRALNQEKAQTHRA